MKTIEFPSEREARPTSIPTKDMIVGVSHNLEAWQLPIGNQTYIANIAFTSVDQDTISWTAGNVKLSDGKIQSVAAGSLDLTATHYLYVVWDNSTLQNTTTYSTAVGANKILVAVASKASTAAQKAYVLNPHTDSILINTDKVMDGLVTEVKIASDAVTAAKISVSGLDGTTGNVAADHIVANMLQTNCVTSDKILANAITSAKINAGAITAAKINASAVEASKIAANAVTASKLEATLILASTIRLGGASTRVELTSAGIKGYSAGNLQFELKASDGKIYAGAGTVILDLNGLTIKGQGAIFRDTNNVVRGYIFGVTGSEFCIQAYGSTQLTLQAGVGYNIVPVSPIAQAVTVTNYLQTTVPFTNGLSLGGAASKWLYGYFTNLPACPVPTSNSAIDVINMIRAPAIMKGEYGERYYFQDEDFPVEMKIATERVDKESNKMVGTGKMEIEFVRTIGILVQATRELIARVGKLENVH